jgi:hypothetical protein
MGRRRLPMRIASIQLRDLVIASKAHCEPRRRSSPKDPTTNGLRPCEASVWLRMGLRNAAVRTIEALVAAVGELRILHRAGMRQLLRQRRIWTNLKTSRSKRTRCQSDWNLGRSVLYP